MNCIAIDTITGTLSVTAQGPSGIVTLSVEDGGQHAPALVGYIADAMDRAGFSAPETGMIAVHEGPGSFTGLRLAWAAAKALALASEGRIVSVPTLDAYALPYRSWPGAVVSVLDAKKNRFYVRVFRQGIPVTESMDISPGGIRRYLDLEETAIIVGPDAELFAEGLGHENSLLSITPFTGFKAGASRELLFLAQTRIGDYTRTVPDHAGPVYVRKSDAEIEADQRRTDAGT